MLRFPVRLVRRGGVTVVAVLHEVSAGESCRNEKSRNSPERQEASLPNVDLEQDDHEHANGDVGESEFDGFLDRGRVVEEGCPHGEGEDEDEEEDNLGGNEPGAAGLLVVRE